MRRIRKAQIRFVSLVPKGANRLAPIYKADGSLELQSLVKAGTKFDEDGELLSVVYAPELRDSQGDIADAEVVKAMAYDFIANGAAVDVNHDGKPLPREKARVAETFIVQKSDVRFHGWKDDQNRDTDLTGSWATVIKIDDPDLRKKYRSGEWSGVSMGGTAVVEAEKSLTSTPSDTDTMDEAKILKAITDGFTGLTTELTKALAPKPPEKPEAPKPPEKPTDDTPVFKGKVDDERALELHARDLQLHSLKKACNFNDPAAIRAYREEVTTLKAAWAEEDREAGVEDKPVAKTAVKKAGVAPAAKNGGSTLDEQFALGVAIAKAMNGERAGKEV